MPTFTDLSGTVRPSVTSAASRMEVIAFYHGASPYSDVRWAPDEKQLVVTALDACASVFNWYGVAVGSSAPALKPATASAAPQSMVGGAKLQQQQQQQQQGGGGSYYSQQHAPAAAGAGLYGGGGGGGGGGIARGGGR